MEGSHSGSQKNLDLDLDDSENECWKLIETKFGVKIPLYLQNLLTSQGFDNILSIKSIDKDDIAFLEEFAKSEKYPRKKDVVMKDYLGTFEKSQKEFEILRGHKKMLFEVVQRISEEVSKGSLLSVTSQGNSNSKKMKFQKKGFREGLKHSYDSAEKNRSRHQRGYRHDNALKMFAAYLRIIGGKLLYETIHANLPTSMPAPSTIATFIADTGPKIAEGMLRTEALLAYLTKKKLPLVVSISEDATRTIAKVCYDPTTNKLVGFSLPLNEDGMPITKLFLARSAAEIHDHFMSPNNHISTMAYTIMVQPLVEHVPPFTLSLFSTDNKFIASNVLNRFAFIKRNLAEKGILAYTHASDGDSRLLKAMKINTGIGIPPELSDDINGFKSKWFSFKLAATSAPNTFSTVYFQDYIHVATKFRNRLLRPSSILPMGKFVVSKSHLDYLINNVSKDKHLLTATDINPLDRQNFESAEKICDKKIQSCLKTYVPGSKGTILYLKVMNMATSAMLESAMTPSDRILNIWYAIFVLRAWRSWLLRYSKCKTKKTQTAMKESANKVPEFKISENFVSCNAYTCVEINGHSLIHLIIQLRDREEQHFFLPLLMGSQPCESTFRQLRSMTTTNSTVINFNILEMIHRIRKMELQNEIFSTAPDYMKFPRLQNKKESIVPSATLPSNEEIVLLIESARNLAINDLSDVGIIDESDRKLNFKCQVSYIPDRNVAQPSQDFEEDDLDDDIDDEDEVEDEVNARVNDSAEVAENEEENPDLQKDLYTLSSITGELMLKDYSNNVSDNEFLDERSAFAVVVDSSGKRKVVRKSTICWLLTKDKHSLSNDRLSRVKDAAFNIKSKNTSSAVHSDTCQKTVISVCEEIAIGQWCLFRHKDSILVSLVLGFAKLNGTKCSTRNFTHKSCIIKDGKDANNPIGVLCSHFRLKDIDRLEEFDHPFYSTLDCYKGSLNIQPTFDVQNDAVIICSALSNKIKELQGDMKNTSNSPTPTSIVDPQARPQNTSAKYSSADSKSPEVLPDMRPNEFVIVSVPAVKGSAKNFIAMIIEEDPKLGLLVSFLKKSFDKYFFPEVPDLSYVSLNEIVKVLRKPIKNKRDQYKFNELKKEDQIRIW